MHEGHDKTDILVYGKSGEYASFPMLTRTEDELILLFSVQPLEKLKAAKIHPHYQKFAQPQWAVSRDKGRTWITSNQSPHIGNVSDTTYASAPLLDGGMATLTFTTEPPIHALIEHGSVTYRPYHSISPSITPHPVMDYGPFRKFFPHAMVRTDDGALLAGGYAPDPTPVNPNRTTIVFLHSRDEGHTWRYHSSIPNDHPFGFSEPALLPGNNGQVLAIFRTDWDKQTSSSELPPDAGVSEDMLGYYLYQSISSDFGRTWTPPVQLPFWGHPPCLKRFSNGDVLLLFGVRRKPFGIQAVLSRDDGSSWDLKTLRYVHEFNPGGYDLGYPVATILEDGLVVCAYYGCCSDDVSLPDTPHGIFVSLFDHEWLNS